MSGIIPADFKSFTQISSSQWFREDFDQSKLSKRISFSDWFGEYGSDSMFLEPQEVRRRFRASHPASIVYTIHPDDKLAKKAAKVALRTLFYLTVIPIVLVKAIDLFQGRKLTVESDLMREFEIFKNSATLRGRELNGVIIYRKDEPGSSAKQEGRILPASKESLSAIVQEVKEMFGGDQRKALRFLKILGADPSFKLIHELNREAEEILKFGIPQREAELYFERKWYFFAEGESVEKDIIDVDFGKQEITAQFKLRSKLVNREEGSESFKSRVAKVFFDFRKEEVKITWEL